MNSRSVVNNMMVSATVNWFYFLETWLKFPNNLTRLKVGYEETTGLYFMSGRIEIDYEVGELNWCHDVDKPTKRQTFRTTDLFSWFFFFVFVSFSFFTFTAKAVSLPSHAHYAWISKTVLSIMVLILCGRQCSPLPSNEWSSNLTGILLCMTFIPDWTSSPFIKNFAYSFIYDKKRHLLWCILIDREAWIVASRNCETLSVHSCYVLKMHFT